jgi:hypothetical protein
MDKNITLVSAFYIFRSKFSVSKYKEWIQNFMTIQSNKVIFTNQETLPHIQEFDVHHNTKYVIVEIQNFLTSQYDDIWEKHYQLDYEKYHTVNLYKIWAEKTNFLTKAIELNYYKTDYFVWCDIGCFRNRQRMPEFPYWPQSQNIKNKVLFLQIQPFLPHELQNIQTIDNRFQFVNRIGGGIIAGHKTQLLQWHTKYYEMLQNFFKNNVFAGKDQSVYAFTILQNPELTETIQIPKNYPYDRWFYLEDYLK